MRRWVPYPFVRFAVFLIVGILEGIYLEGWIIAIMVLGAVYLSDEKNVPSHLVHYPNQDDQPSFFQGRIISPLKEKSFGMLRPGN